MLGKRKTQNSFSEIEIACRRSRETCKWLREIDKAINWTTIEQMLETLFPSNLGRPGYPPLTMFKALLLQQWYNLSDPELEEMLSDRLSFQKFCDIGLTEDIPDETSFVTFRQRMIGNNMDRKLFSEINRQIEKAGLILKRGTIVDATFIASASRKPSKPRDTETHDNNSDPEAGWGVKRGQQPVYGYKMHIGADQGSQFIRKVEVTPANISDSSYFNQMLSGDEKSVFADKGYMQRERIRQLRKCGIYPGILRKGYRKRRLGTGKIKQNKVLAKIRAPVEGVFGRAKRWYGFMRTRYKGVRRNILKANMLTTAMNLYRFRSLVYA